MLNDTNNVLDCPEWAALVEETAKRAALWEAVEAKISIRYTPEAIIVGGAYEARNALKARGFQWEPHSKTWRFVLTSYSRFKMSGGHLRNCRITRHPEPVNWIVDVARALGIEA